MTGTAIGRLLSYLFDTFPIGTPIVLLDIVLEQALDPQLFLRPAIENWAVSPAGAVLAEILSPAAGTLQMSRAEVGYKTILEVWLETLRDEYERDLARSPLERGVLVGEDRELDTCFTFGAGGILSVLNSKSSVTPFAPLPIRPGDLDIGGLQTTAISANSSTKARALETVMRWNALDRQLAVLLGNGRRKFPVKRGRLNDRFIVGILVNRWAKFRPDDPRNLDFVAAMDALKLNETHRRVLKASGVTDLKSLARALNAAPFIDRYNRELSSRQKATEGGKPPRQPRHNRSNFPSRQRWPMTFARTSATISLAKRNQRIDR